MNIELLQEAYQDDAAVALLWTVLEVVSVADDISNKVELPENRINAFLINGMCALPGNPFFQRHAASILPILHQTMMKLMTGSKPVHAVCDLAEYIVFLAGGPARAKEYAPQIRAAFHA